MMRLAVTENVNKLPKAILFDWDNTLVDTWPVIHDAMNVTLKYMGCDGWDMVETRKRVRRALRETFPELFGTRWQEARDVFYERFHKIHLERLEIIDGAQELIKLLAKSPIYVAVVSNKNGENLRREAEYLGWSNYFDVMVGAADAAKDKPAMEPVLMALGGSGFAPGKEVWFIGDTEIDVQCANNSGCTSILISNGTDYLIQDSDMTPDIKIPNLIYLMGLVLKDGNSIL